VPADDLPVAQPDTRDARIAWGMGDAVLGTIASLVASVVVAGIAFSLTNTASEDTDAIPLWAVALLQLPLWATLLGVAWRASGQKGSGSFRDDFGLRFERRDPLIGIPIGLATQFAIAAVLVALDAWFGVDTSKVGEVAEDLADRADGALGVIALSLVVVAVAPVVEELFYRGLWLRSAARRLGRAGGIVLSSVVFGIIHFQPVDTLALVAFGLVAAWLATRYDRLGPAVWAHVGFNLTAVVSLLATT
jgi:membrane protease YdiL (CAAX protease family)